MVSAGQGESCGAHFFTEQAGVSPQAVAQLSPGFHHLQHFNRGGHNRRRQGVGEQVRAGALTQPLNHLFARSSVAARRATKRFAQRTGDDIYAAHYVAVFVGAAAIFADKANRVRVIHHYQRVVFIRQIAHAFQVGDHAVHGEHAVGGDQHVAGTGFTGLFQAGFQLNHVVVGVAETLRFAQAYTVDDGGVVQGVGDNRVFCTEQGLKQTAVGVEAGGVQNRVFHSEEVRQLLLKLLVAVLGTADKANGGHAEAVGIHAVFRRGNQLRVIRKT